MVRSRFLLLALVALAACGAEPRSGPFADPLDGAADESLFGAPENPAALPEAPEGAPRVLVLGDSLAAGLHLPEEQSFPRALERRLAALGTPVHLTNSGVSGDTTAGGVRRLPWLIDRAKPDIAIIALGSNDGLRGQPAAEVETNLRAMLTECQRRGVRVILLGVRLPPNLSRDYLDAFEGIWPRLAAEYRLAFVPYFLEGVGGVQELNLPDGLHPTPAGHERIAENIAPTVLEVVRRFQAERELQR